MSPMQINTITLSKYQIIYFCTTKDYTCGFILIMQQVCNNMRNGINIFIDVFVEGLVNYVHFENRAIRHAMREVLTDIQCSS